MGRGCRETLGKIHCTDHSLEKVSIGGRQVQNGSAILQGFAQDLVETFYQYCKVICREPLTNKEKRAILLTPLKGYFMPKNISAPTAQNDNGQITKDCKVFSARQRIQKCPENQEMWANISIEETVSLCLAHNLEPVNTGIQSSLIQDLFFFGMRK